MRRRAVGRKRTLLLAFFCLCLLCGRGRAAELPGELRTAAPEAAELVGEGADYGLFSGAMELWKEALETARREMLAGLRGAAAVMAGVTLLGVVEGAAAQKTASRYTLMIGALWVTAMSAGDLEGLIGLGRETVAELSRFSKILLPSLAAATAAMGGVAAASVRQVAAVFFSNVLLTVIERLLMPLVYLYIGVSAADAVLEEETLAGVGRLLKKGITWSLSGLLILFTTYLTVSGAVAGSADEAAVKLAKSAVSGAVPVVGSILAEAAESVLAGAGILRGMIGVFGTLGVLGLCLAPFLRLGVQYLVYQGAALVAAAVGPKKLVELIARLGDAFGLVLAMTASSALLLLISIVLTLTMIGGH